MRCSVNDGFGYCVGLPGVDYCGTRTSGDDELCPRCRAAFPKPTWDIKADAVTFVGCGCCITSAGSLCRRVDGKATRKPHGARVGHLKACYPDYPQSMA